MRRREVVLVVLFLTILLVIANRVTIAQPTYPISVQMGAQNWTAEMREIGETTSDRGLIVWISINNTQNSLPARITLAKFTLELSPHASSQAINQVELRDILVPAQRSFVWYSAIMPAITQYPYGYEIPKPEPGNYVLKITYDLQTIQWFDSDSRSQLQAISIQDTLDPLDFKVVSSEQRLQDDIQQYKHQGYWSIIPDVANPIVSGLIVTVTGGVIVGVILYFLFGRKKKASGVTIGEVQRGGTVVQNIFVGRDNDPESSKRIIDGIPDQLFVGEPRAHPQPVQRQPNGDQRGLIEKVAGSALGNDPLTPIVADALEIARTLKKDEESRWLERELYGYEKRPTDQPNTFPEYRRVPATIPVRLSGITTSGKVAEDLNLERTLFVSFPVKRLEDMVNGARSRDAMELVFWMTTPKELSDLAKELKAQVTSENMGKTPFLVQISDLERLLSELRLRIHKFAMSLATSR
jgi:hypothetical protein